MISNHVQTRPKVRTLDAIDLIGPTTWAEHKRLD